MKRIPLCLLLAACMGLFLLSGCTGETTAEQKEDVTLIVKCPTMVLESADGNEAVEAQEFLKLAGEAFAAQYDKANVTFDVRAFAYVNEVEAITDTFDTADAADLLFEDFFNMAAYIHTGRVVPLDDVITDDIRADIDDASWEQSMVEGRTYMMPYLSRQNVVIYNRAILEECGLGDYCGEGFTIQSWTMDQWTEILDTLAENLPDGVYPAAMYAKNNQGDTHIFSILRAFGCPIFDEEGNFDLETPEGIQALAWLQDGVERGWYPPHPENLEISDCQELFENSQLAFYVFNLANTHIYSDLSDYGFVNFPGNVATSFVTGFQVFDNGDQAKVQAAKDFVQYIYQSEEWLAYSAGNLPESKKTAEKYADRITMLSQFAANAENVVDFMNGSPNWQGNDTSVRSVFWPNIHSLLLGAVTPETCARNIDQACNQALKIGKETSTLHE